MCGYGRAGGRNKESRCFYQYVDRLALMPRQLHSKAYGSSGRKAVMTTSCEQLSVYVPTQARGVVCVLTTFLRPIVVFIAVRRLIAADVRPAVAVATTFKVTCTTGAHCCAGIYFGGAFVVTGRSTPGTLDGYGLLSDSAVDCPGHVRVASKLVNLGTTCERGDSQSLTQPPGHAPSALPKLNGPRQTPTYGQHRPPHRSGCGRSPGRRGQQAYWLASP